MSKLTIPFAVGFATSCRKRGLSVKAAAALLWHANMARQATPAFMEGVKAACEKTPLPPSIPELQVVKQSSVNRAFVKAAKENIQFFDQQAAVADGILKQAFERRRNAVQLLLNAHIMGEA